VCLSVRTNLLWLLLRKVRVIGGYWGLRLELGSVLAPWQCSSITRYLLKLNTQYTNYMHINALARAPNYMHINALARAPNYMHINALARAPNYMHIYLYININLRIIL